jgi:hypothetical protein
MAIAWTNRRIDAVQSSTARRVHRLFEAEQPERQMHAPLADQPRCPCRAVTAIATSGSHSPFSRRAYERVAPEQTVGACRVGTGAGNRSAAEPPLDDHGEADSKTRRLDGGRRSICMTAFERRLTNPPRRLERRRTGKPNSRPFRAS